MSWIAQTLLGAVWVVGGIAIGLGPPLSETGRGASSPGAGWMFAAFGVYLLVAGIRRSVDPPADKNHRPRHATGRAPNRLTAIGQPVAFVVSGLAGFGGIWWGIVGGNVTLAWFGALMASFSVAAFPAFVDVLREGPWRR